MSRLSSRFVSAVLETKNKKKLWKIKFVNQVILSLFKKKQMEAQLFKKKKKTEFLALNF